MGQPEWKVSLLKLPQRRRPPRSSATTNNSKRTISPSSPHVGSWGRGWQRRTVLLNMHCGGKDHSHERDNYLARRIEASTDIYDDFHQVDLLQQSAQGVRCSLRVPFSFLPSVSLPLSLLFLKPRRKHNKMEKGFDKEKGKREGDRGRERERCRQRATELEKGKKLGGTLQGTSRSRTKQKKCALPFSPRVVWPLPKHPGRAACVSL